MKARVTQLDTAGSKVDGLSETLKLQKGKTEKTLRELDRARERLLKSETDLKEQVLLNQSKLSENQARSNELRTTDADIAALYQDVSRATKMKDGQLKRLKVIDSEKQAIQRESETIRGQVCGHAFLAIADGSHAHPLMFGSGSPLIEKLIPKTKRLPLLLWQQWKSGRN